MNQSFECLVQEAQKFAKKIEFVKYPLEECILDECRRKMQYFDDCFYFYGKQTDDFVDFEMLRYMMAESPFSRRSQDRGIPIDTVDDNGYRFPVYEAEYEKYVREVQMGCCEDIPF